MSDADSIAFINELLRSVDERAGIAAIKEIERLNLEVGKSSDSDFDIGPDARGGILTKHIDAARRKLINELTEMAFKTDPVAAKSYETSIKELLERQSERLRNDYWRQHEIPMWAGR